MFLLLSLKRSRNEADTEMPLYGDFRVVILVYEMRKEKNTKQCARRSDRPKRSRDSHESLDELIENLIHLNRLEGQLLRKIEKYVARERG